MSASRHDNPPTPHSEGAAEYFNAYVLCIDVLGFSALTEQHPESPKEVLEVLSALTALNPEEAAKTMWSASSHAFSDTVVYIQPSEAGPENLDGQAKLMSVCDHVTKAQRELLKHDLFIQGGIAWGKVYRDKNLGIVAGPALVVAYRELQERALVPRVAVHESAIPKEWKKDFLNAEPSAIAGLVDGVWFVDYLRVFPVLPIDRDNTEWQCQVGALQAHKNAIFSMSYRASKPRELARWIWVAWYHNLWVRRLLWTSIDEHSPAVKEERKRVKSLFIGELDLLVGVLPSLTEGQPNKP